jgi:hypothetical protein
MIKNIESKRLLEFENYPFKIVKDENM